MPSKKENREVSIPMEKPEQNLRINNQTRSIKDEPDSKE